MTLRRIIPILGLLLAAHLLLCIQRAHAAVILDDGGSHVIDSPSDNVRVFNMGIFPTHVDFLPGALVGEGINDNSLDVLNRSTANIFGGIFTQDVNARRRSVITITGGTMQDDVHSFARSTVIISGGAIAADVESHGLSSIQIFGGSFGEDIEAFGHSQIEIHGGMIGLNGVFDSGLLAEHESIITIFGSNFLLNGAPVGFGPIVPELGILSGVLGDGASFTMPFERTLEIDFPGRGSIILAAVPEPASLLLLVLGVAAITIRRRVQQTAH